jgi:hypothetical protein
MSIEDNVMRKKENKVEKKDAYLIAPAAELGTQGRNRLGVTSEGRRSALRRMKDISTTCAHRERRSLVSPRITC